MFNENAMKIHSLNGQMLKQDHASQKLCWQSKTKMMDKTNANQKSQV